MSDARMNNMEMDIREIRAKQSDMQEDITLIREKIFNGFSHAIEESHQNTKDIRVALEDLSGVVADMKHHVYKSPEQRLADCPYRKEVETEYEKKLKLYFIVAGLLISLVVGLPAWITFFHKYFEVIGG